MTSYRPGSVVLVPLPFSDQTQIKRRPAVVISSHWYNTNKPDIILAAITSTIHTPLQQDEIAIHGAELKSTGLIKEGVVRTGSIFTISKKKIIRTLGVLNYGLFEQVLTGVYNCLAVRKI